MERVLDVRDPAAFAAGHVPGAVNIPRDEIAARIYELPPRERSLLIAAGDPDEAARVAAELRERGWLECAPLAEWPGRWETGASSRHLWEPSPTVARWAGAIPAGPVCDLGCGSGRDSVYLAERGHEVIAIDRLPDALERAARLARTRGVTLTLIEADLRAAPRVDAADFAAILMVRFRAPALFPWVAARVRRGGLFLLETIIAGDRCDADSARAAFPGWTVLDAGSADPVARLVLRREG